jgi:hypothetical protein
MVATTGIFVGYVVGFLYPNLMSGSNPGPVFMALVAVVFSFFVAWIASEGRGRIDGRQPGHQHHSDLRAAGLQRAGSRLSRQPSRGHPASSTTARRWPPTPTSSPPPRTARRCATPAARRCPCWTRPASRFLHHRLSREGCDRQLPDHTFRRFGDCAAQVQLPLHSGHGRHSDPGRL